MKQIFFLLVLSLLLDCTGEQKPDNTPKALQEKSVDIGFSKKRGDDLVENLYKELVSKSTELKELENEIDKIEKNKEDTLSSFTRYHSKSNTYYGAANRLIALISDSVLKSRMTALMNESRSNYFNDIDTLMTKARLLNTRDTLLRDLHTALELTLTLPLIEAYQKDNIPSSRSFEEIVSQFDSVIARLDTLTREKYPEPAVDSVNTNGKE